MELSEGRHTTRDLSEAEKEAMAACSVSDMFKGQPSQRLNGTGLLYCSSIFSEIERCSEHLVVLIKETELFLMSQADNFVDVAITFGESGLQLIATYRPYRALRHRNYMQHRCET